MLGHAITAKTAKMNKKLKMIDLQLRNRRLEQYDEKSSDTDIVGQGVLMDRNEILTALRGTQSGHNDK